MSENRREEEKAEQEKREGGREEGKEGKRKQIKRWLMEGSKEDEKERKKGCAGKRS